MSIDMQLKLLRYAFGVQTIRHIDAGKNPEEAEKIAQGCVYVAIHRKQMLPIGTWKRLLDGIAEFTFRPEEHARLCVAIHQVLEVLDRRERVSKRMMALVGGHTTRAKSYAKAWRKKTYERARRITSPEQIRVVYEGKCRALKFDGVPQEQALERARTWTHNLLQEHLARLSESERQAVLNELETLGAPAQSAAQQYAA